MKNLKDFADYQIGKSQMNAIKGGTEDPVTRCTTYFDDMGRKTVVCPEGVTPEEGADD